MHFWLNISFSAFVLFRVPISRMQCIQFVNNFYTFVVKYIFLLKLNRWMKLIPGFYLPYYFSVEFGGGKCLKNYLIFYPCSYCINVSIQIMSGIVVDLWMRVFIFSFHFHRQWGRRTSLAADMTRPRRGKRENTSSEQPSTEEKD